MRRRSWRRAATPATREIVALRHSYHGRSRDGDGADRAGQRGGWARSQAGIVHAHNAYCYRCPFGLTYPSCEVRVRAGYGRADPQHHGRPHRGLHRGADSGRGRIHHAAEGILPDRGEDRAQSRRAVHQRRSADRLGPHGRQVVRHRAMGRDAGHHDQRQGTRQWQRRSD